MLQELPSLSLLTPLTIFPARKRCTFMYSAAGYANVGANTYSSTQFFNLTGPYDPDYSNFTRNSSAEGFPFYMGTSNGQYVSGRVVHTSVKILFTPVTQANVNICVSLCDYLGVGSDYNTGATVTASQIAQRKKSRLVTMSNTGLCAQPIAFAFEVDPWVVMGISKTQWMSNPEYYFGLGGNPTNTGAFLAITLSDALETAVNISESVDYTIQLVFEVELLGLQYR